MHNMVLLLNILKFMVGGVAAYFCTTFVIDKISKQKTKTTTTVVE